MADNRNGVPHSRRNTRARTERERMERLESQVARLTEDINSLRERCRNGYYVFETKHSMQNFEKNLALYLYPRGRIFARTEIFPRLMTWLNGQRNTPQGRDARGRWLKVKNEVRWNRSHENVLTRLRNLLPDITQPVAMWEPVSFTEVENTCIRDLYRLSQCLADWIGEDENAREQIEAL